MHGLGATFRSLQRADGRARWKISARAGVRELNAALRRRNMPPRRGFGFVGVGFYKDFAPTVGFLRRAGADRQPGADGFESSWDSPAELRLILFLLPLLLCNYF